MFTEQDFFGWPIKLWNFFTTLLAITRLLGVEFTTLPYPTRNWKTTTLQGLVKIALNNQKGNKGLSPILYEMCVPGPRIFQPRQPWLGAHSCLRGHIWLVTIRTSFSNQADIAIMCFWLKCAPLNNEFGSNVPPKTWKTSISALFLVIVHINTVCTYYALLSRVQLCRDYALFWGGHFGPKFAGWGHTNIFEDRDPDTPNIGVFAYERALEEKAIAES